MPKLCAEIGMAERTLRMCCSEILGVSPTRYLLLQRLNELGRRSDGPTLRQRASPRSREITNSWSLGDLR